MLEVYIFLYEGNILMKNMCFCFYAKTQYSFIFDYRAVKEEL